MSVLNSCSHFFLRRGASSCMWRFWRLAREVQLWVPLDIFCGFILLSPYEGTCQVRETSWPLIEGFGNNLQYVYTQLLNNWYFFHIKQTNTNLPRTLHIYWLGLKAECILSGLKTKILTKGVMLNVTVSLRVCLIGVTIDA